MEENFYEKIAEEEGADSSTHDGQWRHGFCCTDEVRQCGFIWFISEIKCEQWAKEFIRLKAFDYEEIHWKGTLDDLLRGDGPFEREFRQELENRLDLPIDEEGRLLVENDELYTYLEEYGA